MEDWREKLILREGEKLQHTGSRMTGSLQETDIDTYDVVDADGAKTGTVTVEDHTAIRGFARTVTVCQQDASGKAIVEESWKVRS